MDSNELEYPVIRNTSVVDSVKDWITDQMIKGNLRPGSKLPTEAELSQRLGVGRNSVREAIKQMEAYGVLYIKRAEGTFVAEQFDPKMLSPIFYSIILQNASWQDFVDLRRAIDVLCDIVFHSEYPQAEVEKESLVVCDEIESYNDSPAELIFDEFEDFLFAGHPLGHNILGTEHQVRSYTTDHARLFTQHWYHPGNTVFFASGNI